MSVLAQDCNPMRIGLGQTEGGGADIVARLPAERMSARSGQTVIVENKSGAGGKHRRRLRRTYREGWLHASGTPSVQGWEPAPMSVQDYAKFLQQHERVNRKLVDALKLKLG